MPAIARLAPLPLVLALAACSPPPAVPAASAPPASPPPASPPPASPTSSAAPATLMELFGEDDRAESRDGAAMNAPALQTTWSMASAGDLSRDDLLFYRGRYAQDLSPRRCDRSSASVTCILVHLTSAVTLRVHLKNNLTVAGPYGCRPVGFVQTSVQARRATFHMNAPPMGGGLCRAHTPLRGTANVGPVGPGVVELVADNAAIEGVSIAPPPGSP